MTTRCTRALWVLAVSACALNPPRIGEKGREVKDASAESAYQEILSKYSDRSEVYDKLDTRMFASATYQSWAFREARVQRLALFQHQTSEELQRNLAVERQEFAAYHDFFFGAHLNDPRYDDFDKRNSIWRIAMITDVGEALPAQVQRIGRSDLNLRAFYPYLDEFWVAYRIRFPRLGADGTPLVLPTTARLTLRVASTLGSVDLLFPAQ